MKDQPLSVTGLNSFSVIISDDAEKRKADALELAATIKTVGSAAQQQDAIAAASLIKSLLKGMEKTREEVKRPVLDAGREIDDIAKLYSGTLKKENDRLEKLSSDWQRTEDRRLYLIREEQERIAREASEKAERERLEAIRMEQERQRLADQARLRELEAIQSAKDDAAREAAQKAADEAAIVRAEQARLAQIEADKAHEKRMEEMRQRQQEQLAVAPVKVEGARVQRTMEFELLDIHALYRARPDLVTLEPKTAMIKAAIAIPGASIPGIRVFESTKVQAKAASF